MLYVNLLFLPNQQKVLSILKLFAKLRKDSGKGGKPTHGEGMKIGQVAQRYSISRDNLYYYINYGLLVPPRMDKQYVFDDETLNDLERILELKELGFTLAEIHRILSLFRISDMEKTGFREELRVIYAKRRRGCQEEIAHLERISGVLSQKIEALSTVDTSEYRRTGLPLSMLGLIQCPHCKKPMAISNVTMDTEYIFEADMDCQCGYHADVCDGILLTPNRYEGNDDTPDVHRLMYKDLPAGMISLFQSAYNFMKRQIDGVNLSGKIVMESYINAWFFLYTHQGIFDSDGRYIIVDKYPETLAMYKALMERENYHLPILYIADSTLDLPLCPSCIDVNIDFFATNEHNFYRRSFFYEELTPLLKPGAWIIGTYFYFENGWRSMQKLLSQYPKCSDNNFSLQYFLKMANESGIVIDKKEICGPSIDSGNNIGFSFHQKGEKLYLLPYTAHRALPGRMG